MTVEHCTCDQCRVALFGELTTQQVLEHFHMVQRELYERGAPQRSVRELDTPEKIRMYNAQVAAWMALQEEGGRVQ